MTIEEARCKWEKKLWDAWDEVTHYFSISMLSPYELQISMNKLVKILDQIACEGFWVKQLSHVKDNKLRGLAFVKADPEDVRMAREFYRMKYREEPWATQESK